jgi:hypothetical protein
MINIIDDYEKGRYMPSVIYTLQQAFKHVTFFTPSQGWEVLRLGTFVILASDHPFDNAGYLEFLKGIDIKIPAGYPYEADKLAAYMSEKDAVLLTDDYAPTDILVAPTIEFRVKTQ